MTLVLFILGTALCAVWLVVKEGELFEEFFCSLTGETPDTKGRKAHDSTDATASTLGVSSHDQDLTPRC